MEQQDIETKVRTLKAEVTRLRIQIAEDSNKGKTTVDLKRLLTARMIEADGLLVMQGFYEDMDSRAS